jgi:hypothetical protein
MPGTQAARAIIHTPPDDPFGKLKNGACDLASSQVNAMQDDDARIGEE